MIDRLQLMNFQGHEKQLIELEPITTFVGLTDAGKSSLIRAIRWVVLNKPRGNSFLRRIDEEGVDKKDIPKEVRARIRVDGYTVARIRRGGTKNLYQLNDTEFKAFGNGMPEDIAELLNCTDVNFQLQGDPPFWLNLTGGEAAKELNDVANLTVIDEATARILNKKRWWDNRLTSMEEHREITQATVDSFDFLSEFEEDVERVAKLEEKAETAKIDVEDLSSDVDALKENADGLGRLQQRTKALEGVVDLARKAGKLGSEAGKLRAACEALRAARSGLRESWPELPAEELEAAREASRRRSELQSFLRECRQANEDLVIANAAFHSKRIEFHEKTKGEKCPVCGGDLNV